MAKYNEILIGRWNRFLQKLTQIKGEPPAAQLAGEVVAVQPFFHGAENRFLESWETFARRFFVSAVAAQFGTVQLRNPTGSNVVIVIESIRVENTLAHEFVYGVFASSADLASIQTPGGFQIDGRTRPNPSAITSQTTLAAVISTNLIGAGALKANDTVEIVNDENQELPITPGFVFQIGGNIANQVFAVALKWRERFLEEAERQ